MNRIATIAFICGLAVLGGFVACSPGALRAFLEGPYEGRTTTYNTCLFVGQGRNQLAPNVACDLQNRGVAHAYEMQGGDNAGTDQDGNPCGFDYGYEQPVPIAGNSFEVEDVGSPGSGEEYTVIGTLDGDTATGTTTKRTEQSRCEIDWTATGVDPGTGGTGGDGGMGGAGGIGGQGGYGGEDEIPPLDDVPDCNAGEPLDFADGTFISGWSEELTDTSPDPESSGSARQAPSGGNPGKYRSIDVSNGTSTAAASACLMSIKEGAVYDPADGAVSGLRVSFQASTPGSEFSSLQTTFSVLVIQGDEMYWSGADAVRVKFADGWVDHVKTESDLHLWPNSSSPRAPDPNGEPLQFGFMTCVNGTREDSAVDNWIVRVCR